MPRSRVGGLDRSLTLAFGALTGLMMIILATLSVVFVSQSHQREQQAFAETIASTLAGSAREVGFSGKYHARQLFETATAENDALEFLSLVGPKGEVIAHSNPERNGNPAESSGLTLALHTLADGRQATQQRWRGKIHITEVDLPIRGGFDNQIIGVLRVGVQTRTSWQMAWRPAGLILLSTLMMLCGAVPVFWMLSRRFASPVRRQAQQLQALLDHTPLYVSLQDSDGNTVIQSRKLLGARTRSEHNAAALKRLDIDGGGSHAPTEQRVVLDGAECTLLASSFQVTSPSGDVQRFWMASDTTELSSASAQRDAFASAVNALPDVVVLADRDGTIVNANPAFTRNLGFDDSSLGGLSLWSLFAEDNALSRAAIEQTLAAGTPWRGQVHLQRANGERGPFQTVLAPLPDRGIVLYARDVAQQMALQTHLQQRQKLEAIGRLAGGVAHDFNNLLTVILGSAYFIQIAAKDDETRQDAQTIHTAATRAKDLTSQLLAFSRQRPRRVNDIVTEDLIEGVVPLVRRLLPDTITLQLDPLNEVWPVRADEGQIQQVLMNLCVNGRDAMEQGGTLTISVRNREGMHGGNDTVLFSVSDTGTGMTAEVLDRMFEPFFTTKEQGKGTGLGLSIVHGVIEQNGGILTVHSAVDKGTTVRFALPRARPQPDRAAPEPRAVGGQERILVVDDEAGVMEAVARMLRSLGYHVTTALSGQDALASYGRGEQPHVLITDLAMPGMSGPELVIAARARGWRTPVVYMSAHRAAFSDLGWQSGDAPVVNKPPTIEELDEAIRQALRTGEKGASSQSSGEGHRRLANDASGVDVKRPPPHR